MLCARFLDNNVLVHLQQKQLKQGFAWWMLYRLKCSIFYLLISRTEREIFHKYKQITSMTCHYSVNKNCNYWNILLYNREKTLWAIQLLDNNQLD